MARFGFQKLCLLLLAVALSSAQYPTSPYGSSQYPSSPYGSDQYVASPYGLTQYPSSQYSASSTQYPTPQYGASPYGPSTQYSAPSYGSTPYLIPQYGASPYGSSQYPPSYGSSPVLPPYFGLSGVSLLPLFVVVISILWGKVLLYKWRPVFLQHYQVRLNDGHYTIFRNCQK